MDFNATIDLIIKDLNEASEIIDDLKKYPGVPALQVELAKSKCRSAGEVIALLKIMKVLDEHQLLSEKSNPLRTNRKSRAIQIMLRSQRKKCRETTPDSIADKFSSSDGSV